MDDEGGEDQGDEKSDDEFWKAPPDLPYRHLCGGLVFSTLPHSDRDQRQDKSPDADPYIAADDLDKGVRAGGLVGGARDACISSGQSAIGLGWGETCRIGKLRGTDPRPADTCGQVQGAGDKGQCKDEDDRPEYYKANGY